MKTLCTCLGLLLAITLSAQSVDSTAIVQTTWVRQADSLMTNYQFEKALTLLQRCDSLNKNVLLRIGQCHFRLGASRAAIRPYERVLAMDSTNITTLNQLGQLYSRDGDFGKAFYSYVRLISLDSSNSYYYKQAGIITQKLNEENVLLAQSFFEKALHFNPADMESSLALGNILLDLEKFRSLDSLIEKALVYEPHYKPLFILKASADFKREHYAAVVTTINGLLQQGDTTATYARLLGASYLHLHEYAKVIPCMDFMLREQYANDYIYYYKGVSYHELGNLKASAENFETAVKRSISENTATYYSQLAHSYEEQDNYQAAIRYYHKAYDFSKEGILLYHLARNYDIYYKDKKTARAYYQKYLESDDTIKVAKEYSRYRVQVME